MKVALVHDFLIEYGGAERVLEALHEIWPQAPVYTAFYDGLGPGMEKFAGWDIRTSWLQRLPFGRVLLSPLRLLALRIFESFDFSDYDLVISSTWMYMAKGIITSKETLHLSYIHTPPRFLYGYPTAREWRKYWWGRLVGSLLNHRMRVIDFQASQRPDHLIANSLFTAKRIEKFYRRQATVIYPPVELPAGFHPRGVPQVQHHRGGGENYFLCVSRLARAKRIDLAIKACQQLGLKLWIIGTGREEKYLRSITGQTIRFLGHLENSELAEAYSGCQALIFPAQDEDFGIVPVEAMGFGKPVIALRSGGVTESVIEGRTGLFFDEPTVSSLVAVLKSFKADRFKPKDCLAQAKKFSEERFQKEIKKLLNKTIQGVSSLPF